MGPDYAMNGDREREIAAVIIVLIILFVIMLVLGVSSVRAHSWYDRDCCSDTDCAPIDDTYIAETNTGYVVPSGELIKYADTRIKQSLDGGWHWCHAVPVNNWIKTYCLYVPPRGT
jgi:hypothetical protein